MSVNKETLEKLSVDDLVQTVLNYDKALTDTKLYYTNMEEDYPLIKEKVVTVTQDYKDLEYVNLIRNEIEAFRLLFIEWVAGFDTNNYIWDDWGLFNPLGAVPPIDDGFDIDDFLDSDDED